MNEEGKDGGLTREAGKKRGRLKRGEVKRGKG